MKNDTLLKIKESAAKRVRVCCDEYHPHTAQKGCLIGRTPQDADAVTIYHLAQELEHLRKVLATLSASFT